MIVILKEHAREEDVRARIVNIARLREIVM